MEYEILEPPKGISGASGVARQDDNLLIVSDDSPGAYFQVRLHSGPEPIVLIPDDRAARHELGSGIGAALGLALDLESIDILADGRVVVLSERLRSILDDRGLVAQYDDPFSELGEKGLEGLAVRSLGERRSRIAVLWEGGYLDESELPRQLGPTLAGHVLNPVVLVHDLDPDSRQVKVRVRNAITIVDLLAPHPAADPQTPGVPPLRFRAPDLVWHEWTHDSGKREWGFIVLLNSETPAYVAPGSSEQKPKKRYGPRWLQRFDMSGTPVGDPLDLDAAVHNVVGGDDLTNANWEGLAWLEPGKRVVLVYDESKVKLDVPAAVILSIPEDWQA